MLINLLNRWPRRERSQDSTAIVKQKSNLIYNCRTLTHASMRSVNIRSRWGCPNYTAKGTALSRCSLRVETVSEIDKATPPLRHSSELGTRALSRWKKGFAEEDHRTLARAGFQAGYAGWSNIELDVEVKQLELYDNSKLHRHERKTLE